jgi:hypothetical protein
MPSGFDPLTTVKEVLVLHLLRQQVEADLKLLAGTTLHLKQAYLLRLEEIHAHLLQQIGDLKRLLKRHGIRVIKQKKNSLDFHIAYLERGYEIQHCFLLATLMAESRKRFAAILKGAGEGRSDERQG